MSTLSFRHINKVYDNKVQAVFDFNLEVADKEFIVFVGPSGCGKSTTLRMVAGLEDITTGELYIDNVLVNDVAPKNRNIAMVFQNYALYPHMTVYDNMAFSLKMRKVPCDVFDENCNQVFEPDRKKIFELKEQIKELKAIEPVDECKIEELQKQIDEENEHPSVPKRTFRHYTKQEIDDRIKEASAILGLEPYLQRKPGQLSGGQSQRVALGRSIVRSPKVFLMDEPLSNLDAKLRVAMRSEIIKIHQKVGATTIYVTHDQTEAMTMADRIVIMKDGVVQQIGSPKEVYANPSNMFVAGFIGSPSMNFFKGKLEKGHFVFDGEQKISVAIPKDRMEDLKEYDGKEIVMGVRPEDFYVVGDPALSDPIGDVEVACDISELLGYETIVYGYIDNQKVLIKVSSKFDVNQGDKRHYCFDEKKMHFFDVETTKRI